MLDTPKAAATIRPLQKGDHIFLVDGSSYVFRAYFAMFKAAQARGRSFTRSDGCRSARVIGFSNMLWKLLREGLTATKPTHVAVVFDHSGRDLPQRDLPRLQGQPARRRRTNWSRSSR